MHFDFDMCFAPQLRALFRHLNFQKCSQREVVREWCVRHNGVHFFTSHLASWLRTRRFSEPTFRPPGATKHWKKHSVSRLSYLFAHLDLLSSDFLFFDLLSSSLLFSDSSHLCFSSVHIVGSLTSKLPSMKVRSLCPSVATTCQRISKCLWLSQKDLYAFTPTLPMQPSHACFFSIKESLRNKERLQIVCT